MCQSMTSPWSKLTNHTLFALCNVVAACSCRRSSLRQSIFKIETTLPGRGARFRGSTFWRLTRTRLPFCSRSIGNYTSRTQSFNDGRRLYSSTLPTNLQHLALVHHLLSITPPIGNQLFLDSIPSWITLRILLPRLWTAQPQGQPVWFFHVLQSQSATEALLVVVQTNPHQLLNIKPPQARWSRRLPLLTPLASWLRRWVSCLHRDSPHKVHRSTLLQ